MFDKLKGKLADVQANKAIAVPISEGMFQQLLDRYCPSTIEEPKLSITNGQLVVTGKTKVKKFGLSKTIDFTLVLQPIQIEGRTMQLQIVSLKPIQWDSVNKKIFHRPPVVTYADNSLLIDLNAIDLVKKVPFGHIKQFDVQEQQLIVSIGL